MVLKKQHWCCIQVVLILHILYFPLVKSDTLASILLKLPTSTSSVQGTFSDGGATNTAKGLSLESVSYRNLCSGTVPALTSGDHLVWAQYDSGAGCTFF